MKHYDEWEADFQQGDYLTFITDTTAIDEEDYWNYIIDNFQCIDDQLFADAWLQ